MIADEIVHLSGRGAPAGRFRRVTIQTVNRKGETEIIRLSSNLTDPKVAAAFVEAILLPALAPAGRRGDDGQPVEPQGPARVRELVEGAGASLVYLPPYSPDLNPIELAFAKLKQLMRSAAHRTADALWADVQRMLDLITPGDAEGFYRHCGYCRPLQVE